MLKWVHVLGGEDTNIHVQGTGERKPRGKIMEGGKVLPKELKSRITQSIITLRINSIRLYFSGRIKCSSQKLKPRQRGKAGSLGSCRQWTQVLVKDVCLLQKESIKPQPRAFYNFGHSVHSRDGPRHGLGAELTEDAEIFHQMPIVDKFMSLHSVIWMPVMEIIIPIWTISWVHVNFLKMLITVTSVCSHYMPFRL